MGKGKGFVGATVDRIVEFLGEKKCYLLADETGIGKTVETREFIYKWWKDEKKEKLYKVLYIAPNLVLAEKNINKLVHEQLKEITEIVTKTDRLSQLPSNDSAKKIQYWAITPAVSFFLEGGTASEKTTLSRTGIDKIEDSEIKGKITKIIELLNNVPQSLTAEEKKY